MKLIITDHYGDSDVAHWHFGFVADGGSLRVAEKCSGYPTRGDALEGAREATTAEFEYGLAMGDEQRYRERLELIEAAGVVES